MVRVCTLPFRLLALEYGADLVYSEETIDWKILRSNKRENVGLGTTEFYDRTDGTIFLSTCDRERDKLVVQIGTSDPDRALRVARFLEPYVAGIDVNMGCPKEFSIKGGMGAALLTNPCKIMAILKTLVKELNVPVTCKIRILPSLEDTLQLCRMIEKCGVAAVAIHGRTKDERPQHSNHDDVIKRVTEVLTIPVIANGGSKEINTYKDIEEFKKRTNACSVMIARAVMWNCSILRASGLLPLDTVIRSYLRNCIYFDNPFTYTKYTVQNMLRDLQESPRGKAFLETQTFKEILTIWNLDDEYAAALKDRQRKLESIGSCVELTDQRRWGHQSRNEVEVVRKTDASGRLISVQMPMQFIRGNFRDADLPKMVMNRYVSQNDLAEPVYSAHNKDRFFIGHVELDGVIYQTSCIEKSRRYAEQAAAMVYLHAHELVDDSYGFVAAAGSRKYQHLGNEASKTPRLLRQEHQRSVANSGRHRSKAKNQKAVSINKSSSSDSTLGLCDDTENLHPEHGQNEGASHLPSCFALNLGEAEKRERREASGDRVPSKVKVFLESSTEITLGPETCIKFKDHERPTKVPSENS
ncbi:hypothetical protein HAZT_HAZT007393 [Hyalella azteca]|nr:hypothetical protein HAZT_HAZT007393 [Hyalella azteca]